MQERGRRTFSPHRSSIREQLIAGGDRGGKPEAGIKKLSPCGVCAKYAKLGVPFTERLCFMKKDIHPNYGDATTKTMNVNTCSACHPYYTGQQTMLDTEGRVDLFMRRYNIKKA